MALLSTITDTTDFRQIVEDIQDSDGTRHGERLVSGWLALPGYQDALESLYTNPGTRVLFADVENARGLVADAGGTVGQADGLRESPEIDDAAERLESAWDALADALLQRWVQRRTTVLLASSPTRQAMSAAREPVNA
jgi:hypothetical protein